MFEFHFSIKYINLDIRKNHLYFQTYKSPLIRYRLEQSEYDSKPFLLYKDAKSVNWLYALYERQVALFPDSSRFFGIKGELRENIITENLNTLRVKHILSSVKGYVSFVQACFKTRILIFGTNFSELQVKNLHSWKTKVSLKNLKRSRLIKCEMLRRHLIVVGKTGIKVFERFGFRRVYFRDDLMANLLSSYVLFYDHLEGGEGQALTVVFVNAKDIKNIVRKIQLDDVKFLDK